MDTLLDTIYGIDFPIEALETCHWLDVELSTFNHRPCFSTGFLNIDYTNQGTAEAVGAYIDIIYPEAIIPMESSMPCTDLGNGTIRFQLGDLSIGESGSFTIFDSTSCNMGLLGLSDCFEAHIYPVSPCFEGDPNWDESSIRISSECDGSNINFIAKNEGVGDMSIPSGYTIFRNNLIFSSGEIVPLNAGDSIIISTTATGHTYHLEAEQAAGHPGNSIPRAFINGCGQGPFPIGFIMANEQNDQDNDVDIECFNYIASTDPNDKTVVPAGYGLENKVNPEISLLEYRIRFQNTGNDTAFNIEVVDTLPATLLDPATFESLNSSHPYEVFMHDSGIVVWSFNNILLPDSNVNEPGSHGYVRFKIRTRPGLPLGTIINNDAAIYFDFNDPVITENCFITLAEDESIITSLDEVSVDVSIQPNPFNSTALITFSKHLQKGGIRVLDTYGRLIRSAAFSGQEYSFNRKNLPSGVYIIQIIEGGKVVGRTRMNVIGD